MRQLLSIFRGEDQLVRVALAIFSLSLILGPIALLPIWGLSSLFIKQVIFTAAVVVLALIGLFMVAVHKKMIVPAPQLLISAKFLILCLVVSALFSESPLKALFGTNYEMGTVAAILVLTCFLTAGVYLARNSGEKLINQVLGFTLGLAIITGVYQIIIFFLGYFSSLAGVIDRLGISTFSSWYESGIWFGLTLIISTLWLSQSGDGVRYRKLAIGAWVLSLVTLVLVNFSQSFWVVVIFLALAYLLSVVRFRNLKKVPVWLIVTLAVGIGMVSLANPGQWLNTKITSLYTAVNRQHLEVRPNLSGTFAITKEIYSNDPAFGVGPNNFRRAWQLYHPNEVNSSPFWNLDFDFALGLFSTIVAETGIVGALGLIIFALLSLVTLARALFLAYQQKKFNLFLGAVGALYLFVFAFSYSTDFALLVYTFSLIGILGGLISVGDWRIDFTTGFWKAVFWPIVVIDLVVVLIFGGWFIARSLSTIALGLVYNNYNSVEKFETAEAYLGRAIFLNPYNDLSYRTAALVQFQKASAIANDKSLKQEEAAPQFQAVIAKAVANANLAIKTDPYNFNNYMLAGQIYEALVPLKVTGAYDSAKDMYVKAQELNPHNPLISFSLARLGLSNSQVTEAKTYLNQSLTQKPNFSQALLTLAQLAYQEGKVDEAKQKSLAAVQSDPNNLSALLQLGYLLYVTGDYNDAIAVLGRATALSPNQINANAQYFIGLSLAKLGKNKEAIDQFKIIKSYNPENTEVGRIIENLTAGREPLASTAPVSTTTPKAKTTKTGQ